MSDHSARLGLPYLAASQAQKHVTHNEALRQLDALVQLVLESISRTAPPAAEERMDGVCWYVPSGASGDFTGQEGKLACWGDGIFDFFSLPDGARAFIRDEDRLARLDGGAWVDVGGGGAQLVLESIRTTSPPDEPEEGARWFVPSGAGGAFTGHEGELAQFRSGAFTFFDVPADSLAFVRDEMRFRRFDGTGAGDGGWVSPLAASPARAAIEAQVLEEDLILSGAVMETSIAIPARAIVLGVSTRTLSGISGATSYDCGVARETGKFGGSLGIAMGSGNSGVVGPVAFYADTPVRLTANGGVFTGGRVRVSIHYLLCPVSEFPELEPDWWNDAAHLLDETAPVLAADFVRERYALAGGHASALDLFSRTGGAKHIQQADGTWGWAPANRPAFDYSSGHRRLVLEGAATNLVKYSSDLLNAVWVRVSSILLAAVSSVPSPTGALNAFVFDCAVNTAGSIYQSVTVTPGSTVTLSVWVRLGTLPASEFKFAFYNDTSGTWINNNIMPDVGPNATTWTRCSATIVVPAGCTSLRVYPLRENSTALGGTVHLFGPQIETGAIATSYIETGAAAVTRVTDMCPFSSAAVGVMSQSGCALALRGATRSAISGLVLIASTSDGAIGLIRAGANPAHGFVCRPGGSNDTEHADVFPGTIGVALGWDDAGHVSSWLGSAPASMADPASAAITAMSLGAATGLPSGARIEIDELVIWPAKGSNSALQAQARGWA